MLKVRTGDQALVREINLSIILNALRDHAPISRAALAAITGLNKTTVSSLIQQLIDGHFVSNVGMEKPEETGRPGMLLELNPRAGCILGVEIGVDFLAVIVTSFAVQEIWRYQEQTDPRAGQDATLRRLWVIIHQALDETGGECTQILGLGLGVPGLVDSDSGTLLFAPNLSWRDVPLRQMLEAEFAFPIYVDNEANMATLGESYFGVARGAKSVLYVSAGVGLGGGIVLDSQVLPGSAGFAGEVGHMTMIMDGLPCNCGNRGCWETLVSQEALFRRIRVAVAAGQRSQLVERTGGDLARLNMPLLVAAAQDGDAVTLAALRETARYLGVGLANLVNALNPEIVVFGGSLSLASRFLLPVVQEVLRERALRWPLAATHVLGARFGFDACVMGGIATVYHQVLSQPFKAGRRDSARVGFAPLSSARAPTTFTIPP